MSQTNAPYTPAMAPAGPVPAPRGPRERRVRFGHLALAIALIVVGALGTATLVVAVTAEGTYLAAARDIAYGAQFTEADLVTVRLNNAREINPVPASEINRVVGNYASARIPAGALLTDEHVTAEHFPGPGEVRIGITLPAERLPGYDIQTGEQVRLVDTTDEETTATEGEPPAPPQSWQATVVGIEGTGGDSFLGSGGSQEYTVDLIVSATDADLIARLAANDNLYLTVLPGQAGG
jgi:SAF domain-containing protein